MASFNFLPFLNQHWVKQCVYRQNNPAQPGIKIGQLHYIFIETYRAGNWIFSLEASGAGNAVDDGPTSRQRWLDVTCLLGSQSNWQVTQRRPSTLCF